MCKAFLNQTRCRQLSLDWTKCLTNDIAIYGREWTPISTFKGVFDGDGHTITGFKIENYAYDYAALFANIIKNVAYNIWSLTPTSRWNKSQKPM